ncbi:MAG: hypothetical protein RIT51_1019 [Actinomycetota bacterium]
MKTAETKIHTSDDREERTERTEPQERFRVIKTTAAKKPKTTRQTTTSIAEANESREMMIGNEPQIKYAVNP